ncbi:MAG: methionine biosynthesis protein MetW, partial [Pseudomonadota bacterium]
LDIGCGAGDLIDYLGKTKGCDARGMEISRSGVNACVARGLSVIQGDADTDLSAYPDDAFDHVVLSQTIQATRQPKEVLQQLLRIGERALVSFPNFGFWRIRFSLMRNGRMPVTRTLSAPWYSTPNIHLCTIRDFEDLCMELEAQVESILTIDQDGTAKTHKKVSSQINWLSRNALFLLRRG